MLFIACYIRGLVRIERSLQEPRFAGAGDPVAALVLCGAHQAKHVMVKGQWKVTDGQLASGDLESLLSKQRQIAARLA